MHCPACRNNNFIYLLQKGELRLIKCTDCKLIQMDNLAAKFDIGHYDYYKNRINMTQEDLYNPITTKRYINLLNRLESYRKNNTILDIGCGEGQFLSVAKRLNWQIRGVEIAPYAAQICRKFNIEVDCRNLLELDLPADYYDIVVMFEVLEHLTKPKEYLLKINSILRKGGILIVTTPNYNCITRRIMQNDWSLIHKEHLFYYTPHSIKKLIKGNNFKIINFKVKIITLPELWGFFLKSGSDKTHIYHQSLRKAAEESRILACFKRLGNELFNLTELGESMECVCQKI